MSVKKVLVILAILVVLLYIFLLSPVAIVSRNMKRVEVQRVVLLPKLASDTRFKDIKISSSTWNKGEYLHVFGSVGSGEDLDALMLLVDFHCSSKGIKVRYDVEKGLKECTFNRKNWYRSYALKGLFPDTTTSFVTSYVCIPSFSAESAMILTHSDSAGYVLKIRKFSENAYFASKKKKAISLFENERYISDSLANEIITIFEFTHQHLSNLNKRHGLDGTTHYVSVCDSKGEEDRSEVHSPRNETVSGRLVQSMVRIEWFISSTKEEKLLYSHLDDLLEGVRKRALNPDENSGDTKNIKKRKVSFTKDLGAL